MLLNSTHTTPSVMPQRIAIVLAGLLWAVGSAYLVQSELRHAELDYVAIAAIPLVWAVVIALPILAHHALREGRLGAAAMLSIAAVVGSAYTLNGTIGRQAEKTETAVLEAEASGEGRKLLEDELKRTKISLDDAHRETRLACKSKSWTDNCQGMERREKAYQARVDQLVAAIGDAPAAKPKASGNRRVTEALVLISGKPASVVEPWVSAFGDSLLGLLLELGALALGFYGCSPARTPVARSAPKGSEPSGGKDVETAQPALPAPMVPLMAAEAKAEPAVFDEDTAAVLKALKGRQAAMTNEELRAAIGRSKGQTSKVVTKAERAGLVTRERNGREVQIRLNSEAPTLH